MSMWRDDALLLDMLIAARHARAFNSGKSWPDFAADMLQSATQYQLQIIGEAASKVSHERRNSEPGIPWAQIISFRNRVVHDYPNIELTRVWSIIQEHLASLIEILDRLVPPDNTAGEGSSS